MAEISVSADSVFPVLKENILVDGFHVVIDLQRSHGCVIVDALAGKEYLDCYGYFATLPVGQANPANSDIYSREFAGFVKTFREIAVPDEFRYLFFIAGGALAVENAMKAAFDWKVQKNRAKGIDGGGDKILHFVDAFHGRSGYTLSVTNTDPVKIRDFPKFDWPRISSPKTEFPIDDPKVAAAEDKACKEIEAAFAKDPHGIAAILIEPIQCEGGDNHLRPEFLQRLREYADEHEALLIYDEVQTGMGVTGTVWAYQQLGPTPDIIAFGKKTQVCGIMSTRRIDEVEKNVFHVSSRINSTWGGNLVDMVRCARYLQIMKEDGLVESAAKVGHYFKEGLEKLRSEFPTVISNVRGRGLILAFDLPDGEYRNKVRQGCWDRGLATLPCGPRSLRFRPPLIFSKADADRVLGTLRSVLA
jgi:L-lysine 6-transaminase